ncbi:MAG: mismatch repair protein MutS2, partial [Candidatus Eremiobacteraeota bacterium]|nr:mismatch repair protein MutS2 [Candidatus Eremiobacteraeota bacterium]
AFGRRYDEATVPYGPGDEARAQAEIADVVALARRFDADGVERLRAALRAVPEATPIVARARAGDALTDVDFYELGRFVDALAALAHAWDAANGDAAARPPELGALRGVLAPGRDGVGFYLADTFAPGLRAARAALAAAESAVDARRAAIAARVRAVTGVDPVGEEFVVLRDVYDGALPDGVRVVRETPTYRAAAIVVLSPERDAALARLSEEEERARHALAERIAREADAVAAAARALGALDHTLARVAFAQRRGACVPTFAADRLAFDEATFAPLADALRARGHRYTPLSLDLRGVAVLTGPNMGGKSAALAAAGFVCACISLGVPPPARSASLPLLSTIVWIGGEGPEDRARLLSSYAAEVVRARDALAGASARTLVLVDEFARTTGPREGRALLVAFVEALHERGTLALVATHFDGVAQAASAPHLRIAGLRVDALDTVQADDLDAALDAIQAAMDYRIVAGREGEAASDALALARLLGLDAPVVDRARALNADPDSFL